jgi:hypothetical protein
MARQMKLLPARKPRDRFRDDDDSLLLRSAESLGRVIGALQKQLDGATRRLSHPMGDGDSSPARSRIARKSTAPPPRKASARQATPSIGASVRRSRAAATKTKSAKKR